MLQFPMTNDHVDYKSFLKIRKSSKNHKTFQLIFKFLHLCPLQFTLQTHGQDIYRIDAH